MFECARILRENDLPHTADFSRYKGHTCCGPPVGKILEEHSALFMQPIPSFGASGNCPHVQFLKKGISDPKARVWDKVVVDVEDVTEVVKNAWKTIIATCSKRTRPGLGIRGDIPRRRGALFDALARWADLLVQYTPLSPRYGAIPFASRTHRPN